MNAQEHLDQTNFFLDHFSDITSLLEVILVGIYVYFTIKTFKQIKQQTDLQLKAYLNVEDELINEPDLKKENIEKSELNIDFTKDWRESMEKAFPALSGSGGLDGGFYSLHFTNYGNTEIKCIQITCSMIIQNSSESVDKKKLVKEDSKKFNTEIKQILKKGETVTFPLFSTAAFPIFSITTCVTYIDVRNQNYQVERLSLNGENKHLQ